MGTEQNIKKLWDQANILRNDGVSYSSYLTELSFLVFIKMVFEQDLSDIPPGYQWSDLRKKDGIKLMDFYSKLLSDLGKDEFEITIDQFNLMKNDKRYKVESRDENGLNHYYFINEHELLKRIFFRANSSISEPSKLKVIINELDEIDWFSEDRENLGDMYEGLLEKNGEDTKSGAGQYFTPRVVIDAIVEVMKPKLGQKILDPAAGTFGFMVKASQYIRKNNDFAKLDDEDYKFQTSQAYSGMELVDETYRLALMNALLHRIQPDNLKKGNSLTEKGMWMKDFDMVLTNPPFGIANERASRSDVTYNTSNKQLNFLQVIYNSLKKDGKASAAVVIPDGVLSGTTNQGPAIRKDLLNKTNVHTILRLPTGIFYKPGVKTYVLFFTRGTTDYNNTKEIWVYDLRALNHFTPKKNKLTREDFEEFISLYKNAELEKRNETWSKENLNGRWKKFLVEDILATDDINLDLHWIKEVEEIKNVNDIFSEYEYEKKVIDEKLEKLIIKVKQILEETN